MSTQLFKHHAIALAVGSVALFSGCAAPQLSSGLRIEPIMAVRNGIDEGERMYRIGRYFQGQTRLDSAQEAYLKALAANPNHVEARNALATVYFERGWMQKAEEQFKLAIAAAPERAHLYNNLGYLYQQIGRKDEAIAAFNEARQRDPNSARIRNNLAAAQGIDSQPVAASVITAPVVAGTKTELRADTKPEPASVPDPDQPTVRDAVQPSTPAPTVQLASVAPNVWELQPLPQAAPALAPAPRLAVTAPVAQPVVLPMVVTDIAAIDPPAAPALAARIEIANGNGVTGLARRVGLYLREQGYAQQRLTNSKPFNLQRTEIHYVPGAEALARQIGESLAQPPRLVPAKRLDRQVPVRLVLGKDFHESEAIAKYRTPNGNLVALAARTERK